jgi:nucleoside-diphosphate-sugar epimerase
MGHPRAIGDTFHITTDDFLTWNQIAQALAAAAGVEAQLVHVPSDAIAAADAAWGAGLLGDKAHSLIFDNSNLRRLVPDFRPTISFEEGAQEIVAWYDEDPQRQQVDTQLDGVMDKLVEAYTVT